jgi:hypothetical protein
MAIQPIFTRFLLLFGLLLAMPGVRLWACGEASPAKAEQAGGCCAAPEAAAQTGGASCEKQVSEHENCPCDHRDGGCHCPGCGAACHAGPSLSGEAPVPTLLGAPNDALRKMAFYYALHLPDEVSLPIWQPPQLLGQ